MTRHAADFCALILAGGRSRRMGRNKALLKPESGGLSLIERVIQRVRLAGPVEIYIVANDTKPYKHLGLPVASDEIEGIGPLGGIIGGLRASRCQRNLVVGCDMPYIDADIITHLVSIKGENDAIVPRWRIRGEIRMEPLHAIYTRPALPKLRECAASGNLSLLACLEALTVRYVDVEPLQATRAFSNLNSPDDWQDFLSDHA